MKITDILTVRVTVDNSDDAGRQYIITSDGEMNSGTVTSVSSGTVAIPASEDGMEPRQVATFNSWDLNAGQLSITFEGNCARAAVMAAVETFLSGVQAGLKAAIVY